MARFELYNARRKTFRETYRLDGDSATAAATPLTPVHANNAAIIPLVEGQSVTISGEYKSMAWFFRSPTTVGAIVTVNGLDYIAETGPAGYVGQGVGEDSDTNENFDYETTFTAGAGCHVEIIIERFLD